VQDARTTLTVPNTEVFAPSEAERFRRRPNPPSDLVALELVGGGLHCVLAYFGLRYKVRSIPCATGLSPTTRWRYCLAAMGGSTDRLYLAEQSKR
jgi:hypothetical protein